MTTHKVGYLIGSLAKGSINRKLAKALVRLAPSELAMSEISFKDLPLYSYPEVARHIAEATALGRPGLPDDIGPMIASLLSEDNRWVNAQRIEVSGGQAI